MILSKPHHLVQPPDVWLDSRPLPWLIDLSEWLRVDGDYGPSERSRILTGLLDHGTLVHAAESGLLDPEDYPLLESIFCESQPPIPWEDPAWDCDGTWELGPEIPPGTVLAPLELIDDADGELIRDDIGGAKVDWRDWRKRLGLAEMPPPLSGGSPEAPPAFERLAQAAQKIISLQAELAAVPDDWRLYYYPF
jgi:hypothetical protein